MNEMARRIAPPRMGTIVGLRIQSRSPRFGLMHQKYLTAGSQMPAMRRGVQFAPIAHQTNAPDARPSRRQEAPSAHAQTRKAVPIPNQQARASGNGNQAKGIARNTAGIG
jgi:hypothetical protein